MKNFTPMYFLGGPTASGKTDVAHLLAERMGLRCLSVDSMMVYRGMDIGTAKPTEAEQHAFAYAGLNLVDPGQSYSTGEWLRDISAQLDERPTLAVGGTGLYFKALMLGLEEDRPSVREDVRPVSEMQQELEELRPGVLARIADPDNPRRLERALQRVRAGLELPEAWTGSKGFPIPVLLWDREKLNERIELRIRQMMENGLQEEVQRLESAQQLTGTAAQAIGYQEALSILKGEALLEEAIQKLATRTRRYAKRQRTWFRNQMDSHWVEVDEQKGPKELANEIEKIWEQTGPFSFPSISA